MIIIFHRSFYRMPKIICFLDGLTGTKILVEEKLRKFEGILKIASKIAIFLIGLSLHYISVNILAGFIARSCLAGNLYI